MLTLLLTAFAILAGLAASHALRVQGAAARAVFAGTTAGAIVVGAQTALGLFGILGRAALVAAAAVTASAVLAAALFRLGRAAEQALRTDLQALREGFSLLRRPELAALALVAVVGLAWVAAAVRILPPRSIDDLAHHLPPVFEAAARGRFALLPLQVLPWFAYPLNADLFSLWPALLERSVGLVDAAQIATALLAALAVVALARDAGASRRRAAFAGLVFLLFPVVLRQACSCYTDVTIAAFFGAACLGLSRYARGGGGAALLLGGLGCGLLGGTKYHLLFSILLLLPLLAGGIRRAPSRQRAGTEVALLFAAPAAALSGFWLLRNWSVLGNPFYPYALGLGPATVFPGSLPDDSPLRDSVPLLFAALRRPLLVWRSLLDPGLGSVDGGFGPAVWGVVLPLGVWMTIRALARFRRERDVGHLALALPFIAGLAPYAATHEITQAVTARFLLTATIPALAFLALALTGLDERGAPARRLATAGLTALAVLGVVQLGGDESRNERKQLMNLAPAVAAKASPVLASRWRPLSEASFGVNRLAPVWDFLDLVTAPPGRAPLSLWVQVTGRYIAPFYGSRLQNRIWNAGAPDRPPAPDVFSYTYSYFKSPPTLEYFGESQPLEDVVRQPDLYEAVFSTSEAVIYFRKSLLAEGAEVRRRLLAYYDQACPDQIAAAGRFAPRLADSVVLAVDQPGSGLKALEMTGRLRARVLLVARAQVPAALRDYAGTQAVWIFGPPGEKLTEVERFSLGGREVALYKAGGEAP